MQLRAERRILSVLRRQTLEERRVPRDKGGMLDATVLGQHRKQQGAESDSLAIRLIILPKRDLRTYLPDEEGFTGSRGTRVPPFGANRPLTSIDHRSDRGFSRANQFTRVC